MKVANIAYGIAVTIAFSIFGVAPSFAAETGLLNPAQLHNLLGSSTLYGIARRHHADCYTTFTALTQNDVGAPTGSIFSSRNVRLGRSSAYRYSVSTLEAMAQVYKVMGHHSGLTFSRTEAALNRFYAGVLWVGIIEQKLALVKFGYQPGAIQYYYEHHRSTPLGLAAFCGFGAGVKYMLGEHANPNQRRNLYDFNLTLESGTVSGAEALLDAGYKIAGDRYQCILSKILVKLPGHSWLGHQVLASIDRASCPP